MERLEQGVLPGMNASETALADFDATAKSDLARRVVRRDIEEIVEGVEGIGAREILTSCVIAHHANRVRQIARDVVRVSA